MHALTFRSLDPSGFSLPGFAARRHGLGPWRLSSMLDAMFEGLQQASPTDSSREEGAWRLPAMDVTETDQAYQVLLEMPGVRREQIAVEINDRSVTVRADPAAAAPAKEAQDAGAPAEGAAAPAVLHRERLALRYTRSFSLPQDIEAEGAQARMEDGVLTLTLPKRRTKAAAKIVVA